jgi:hypothetical protein
VNELRIIKIEVAGPVSELQELRSQIQELQQQASSVATPPTDAVSIRSQVSQITTGTNVMGGRNEQAHNRDVRRTAAVLTTRHEFVQPIPSPGRIHRLIQQQTMSATQMPTHAASVATLLFSIPPFEQPTSMPTTPVSNQSRTSLLSRGPRLTTILTLGRLSFWYSMSLCTMVIAWIIR